MREIKFRGQDGSGCFYHGSLIIIDHGGGCMGYYIQQPGSPIQVQVEKDTVGQYTGEKNKNCVDVYEGDILECDISKTSFDFKKGQRARFLVEWKDKGFCDNRMGLNVFPYDECETVGNIHENPELMKS